MGKVLVIRKQEGGGPSVGVGSAGLMFMLGSGGMMSPKELAEAGFGEIGSDSHNRALDMQKLGKRIRYGAAGLGAFNALYNQTSSGQPGIGSAMTTGAMGGYAGTAGAEDIAARMGQRFGRELDDKAYAEFTEGPEIASPSPEPMMLTEGFAEMDPMEPAMETFDSKKRMADLMENYREEEDPRMADIGRNF